MIEPAERSQFAETPQIPQPIIEKVLVKDGDKMAIAEEFKGWRKK